MILRRLFVAAAMGLAGGGLLLASPAEAHHVPPVLAEPVYGDCGETTLLANLPEVPHGSYAGAALVVEVGEGDDIEHYVQPLGMPITVGPFDEERVAIRWRIWGGGERGYDVPALDDLGQLLQFLNGLDRVKGGGDDRLPTDEGAWGVAWNHIGVEGCVPDPEPTPTASPTVAPTPSTDATVGPTSEPASGAGGGDDELAMTGFSWSGLLPVGAIFAVVGAGLLLAARLQRRRSTRFTAE